MKPLVWITGARGLKIEPVSLKEYQGAPHPPDTSLNCAKAETLLGTPLPRFADRLTTHPNEAL